MLTKPEDVKFQKTCPNGLFCVRNVYTEQYVSESFIMKAHAKDMRNILLPYSQGWIVSKALNHHAYTGATS